MKYNILLISKETSIKSRIFTLTKNFANTYWTKSMQDGLFHLTMFSYHLIIVDMIQDMKFTYGVIKTIRKFKKLLILALASEEIENIPTHSRYFSDELVGSCAWWHVKNSVCMSSISFL